MLHWSFLYLLSGRVDRGLVGLYRNRVDFSWLVTVFFECFRHWFVKWQFIPSSSWSRKNLLVYFVTLYIDAFVFVFVVISCVFISIALNWSGYMVWNTSRLKWNLSYSLITLLFNLPFPIVLLIYALGISLVMFTNHHFTSKLSLSFFINRQIWYTVCSNMTNPKHILVNCKWVYLWEK